MRTLAAALLLMLALLDAAHAVDIKLDSEEQRTLYALGLALSRNLAPFGLTPAELDVVEAGLSDALFVTERKVDLDRYGQQIRALAQARAKAAAEAEKQAGAPFLEKAARDEGARKLASGLIYVEEKAGAGDAPSPTDMVKVHYTGTRIDGTVFDSSVERDAPATFPLGQVIKCWTEGIGMMRPGGKAKLVCPSDLAYGDRGAPPKIKPGATLVFDVELLEVMRAPAASPTPEPKK